MPKHKPQFTIAENPFDQEKYGERIVHHLNPIMHVRVNIGEEIENAKEPEWRFDYMHPLHRDNIEGSKALIRLLAELGFQEKSMLWLAQRIGMEAMQTFQEIETVQFVLEYVEKVPDLLIEKKIKQMKHWYMEYLTQIDLDTLEEQIEVWINQEIDDRQAEIRMN